ncbi:MAG: transcription factor TFIIIB subunit brf1 [Trizodia sp. TS-e1964]|nr:MAG: transcription factor TFIIIB subunit brf1 [Trizodia sp. TS-e1964]
MFTNHRPKPVTRLGSLRIPPPPQRARAKAAATRAPVKTCPKSDCTNPQIDTTDDKCVCTNCGYVFSDSNIVSEVQFGETSAGAPVLQGSYVGADQGHARSMGTAFKRAGGMVSREVTDQNGRRYINQLAAAVKVPQSTADTAFQVFKLAVAQNFIQGRKTKHVAAVCLYVACRRQDRNKTMLIDFSDVLNVNVFKLGQTFKILMKQIPIQGIRPVFAEDLIYRFAAQLEFGAETNRVALDAARIIQRMERDWMVTGRRPSGICGACLILAARMNNFRRSVKEVVYVVKVADLTINKRLDEFKCTDSSELTVEQFRTIMLEKRHDPPAFYEQFQKKKKRKRGFLRLGEDEADAVIQEEGELENAENAENAQSQPECGGSQTENAEPRRDADGFLIPDLPTIPIDPALLIASAKALSELATPPLTGEADEDDTIDESLLGIPSPKRHRGEEALVPSASPSEETTPTTPTTPTATPQRGRPRKDSIIAPIVTQLDEAVENALESEINEFLNDPSTKEHAAFYDAARAVAIMRAAKALAEERASTGGNQHAGISMEEEISPNEFDRDPEVINCLLSVEEQEIKERIWLHENRDYLRDKQAKTLKKQIDEKNGPPIVRRRRRKGRIGEGINPEGSVASSPKDAIRGMLDRRGFSKKINYEVMENLFGESESRASRESSRANSRATSVAPVIHKKQSAKIIKKVVHVDQNDIRDALEIDDEGGDGLGGFEEPEEYGDDGEDDDDGELF